MGLDSRDHTKSGPTGSGSFLHDVIRQRDGKRKLDPSGKSPDLAPLEHQKFTNKLDHFWTLDFAAFRAEVKRALKTEIAVKDRGDWEEYLAEKSAEVTRLSAEVEAAEREIDAIVYKLFDLTTDEVRGAVLMMPRTQPDLFVSDAQSDLLDADLPTPEYRADPDSVRAEPHKILAEARAAQKLPWEPKTVLLYRTIFPQMTNWLPDEEGAQLRFEFEIEIKRLEAA